MARVRFPCDHNVWFRHMIKGTLKSWCDGGRTVTLRYVPASAVVNGTTEVEAVWIEVKQ